MIARQNAFHYRKCLRDGAQSDAQNQGLPEPQNSPVHGLQTYYPSLDIAAQYPVRKWSAKKKWRKLSGTNPLPEVIQGVEFKDGIKQPQNAA
jgi:hypothetical protein